MGGRILKGASPREFPIVDPQVLELAFSLGRASDLNVTIPLDSLIRADRVYD